MILPFRRRSEPALLFVSDARDRHPRDLYRRFLPRFWIELRAGYAAPLTIRTAETYRDAATALVEIAQSEPDGGRGAWVADYARWADR